MFRTVLTAALLSTSALAATNVTTPAEQAAREKAFDAQVSSAEQMAWLNRCRRRPTMSARPTTRQMPNSPGQVQGMGLGREDRDVRVLYPTPISTTLELVAPSASCSAAGADDPRDSTSGKKDELPAYVAFQGDGDVTAPLVYVNYGMPDDYKALERIGVDVKGKIGIARYGRGWRGLKPKLAQDHGAVGCIIYSDPRDDGYSIDDAYPKGAARPPNRVSSAARSPT